MSLLNRNFLMPDGTPITGRTPTQIIVNSDQQLTLQQRAMVEHAYKLFCDGVRLSPAASGYHVQNRQLPDGTRIRMESNGRLDRVMVWPEGGEEYEILFLASPRAVYDSGTLLDGDAGREVYLYSLRGNKPIRLKKPRVFAEKDGNSALNQQPGNCVWYDDRPEGRQTKNVLSWWGRTGISSYHDRIDRVSTNGVLWNTTTDHNRLYLNGEFLVKFTYPIYGAGIFVAEDGTEIIRVATVRTTNFKTIDTFQFSVADANTPANWIEDGGGANFAVFSPCQFNAAATHFCCIESNTTASGDALQVVEYAFSGMTKAVVFSGYKEVSGAPTISGPTNTYTGCSDPDATLYMTDPFDGTDFFGAVSGYGTIPEFASLVVIPYADVAATETNIFHKTYSRSGSVTITTGIPVVSGYVKNKLAYFVSRREKVASVSETFEQTITVSALVTKSGAKHEYYDGATLVAVRYEGSVGSTDRNLSNSYESAANVIHTARLTVDKVLDGVTSTVFETDSETTFSWSNANHLTGSEYSPAGSGLGGAAFTETSTNVSTALDPDPAHASFTATYNSGFTTTYDSADWTERQIDVYAADVKRDFIGIAEISFSPSVVVGGKIAQTLRVREFLRGNLVFDAAKTEKPIGPDGNLWSPPAAEKILVHAELATYPPIVVVPSYDKYNFSRVLYDADTVGQFGEMFPTTVAWVSPTVETVGYNTFDRNEQLFVSPNLLAINESKLKDPIIVSGLAVSYGFAMTGQTGVSGANAYTGFNWQTGPGNDALVRSLIGSDKTYGLRVFHHVLRNGVVVDDLTAVTSMLPENAGTNNAWLSSPIYLPTWKVPK